MRDGPEIFQNPRVPDMTVYALIDCRDEQVCYVGCTREPLHVRLSRHKCDPKHGVSGRWTWLQRHPVRIEKVCDGMEFEEKREIAKIINSGGMLFNKQALPKMRAKDKRNFKLFQKTWVEKRIELT